jgi:hypothetical protein
MIDQHIIIVPCQMESLEKIFDLYNLAPFVGFGPLVFCLLLFIWKSFEKNLQYFFQIFIIYYYVQGCVKKFQKYII